MSNKQIIDLYDSNPNMTLQRLSQITGKSVSVLKQILLDDVPTVRKVMAQ